MRQTVKLFADVSRTNPGRVLHFGQQDPPKLIKPHGASANINSPELSRTSPKPEQLTTRLPRASYGRFSGRRLSAGVGAMLQAAQGGARYPGDLEDGQRKGWTKSRRHG